ncbi:MAG: hypothetical protein D6725_10555 [Planctomycetota bacterium]|nr:MAG: hypothetical protein D6725_10555 [Planctomycetota bacterium]
MHWLGKVLAWLNIIGFGAAVVLMGRTLQVRNSWAKKVAEARVEAEKGEPEVHQRRKRLIKLTDELQMALLGWNRYWDNVTVLRSQATRGALVVQLGENQGLQNQQTVYVFQPGAESGQVEYVGAFRVTQVEENRAAMSPTWRLIEGEEVGWRYGAGWRIWASIPPSSRQMFSDLDVNFVLATERKRALEQDLKLQNELKKEAEQQLAQRMAELVGGGDLPAEVAKDLPEYLVVGLVNAIQSAEQARNEALVRVDRLRRQIKRTVERYEQLRDENLRLAGQLAGSPIPAAATSAVEGNSAVPAAAIGSVAAKPSAAD